VSRRDRALRACVLLAVLALLPARGPRAQSKGRDPIAPSRAFPVTYERPADPRLVPYLDAMVERQVLERISHALAFIRLPRPLRLVASQCDESNAWYDGSTRSVTFCYEYVRDLVEDARRMPPGTLAPVDAAAGAFVFLFLHEIGHALFDLLRVPVLGREEDAADQVAAFVLLRAGPDLTRRTLLAAAWMFRASADSLLPDESDYASDEEEYAGAVGDGRLPPERAEGCAEEYAQVEYAVRKTMAGGVDRKAFARLEAERARAHPAPDRGRRRPDPGEVPIHPGGPRAQP
jgi:hypothetical protein